MHLLYIRIFISYINKFYAFKKKKKKKKNKSYMRVTAVTLDRADINYFPYKRSGTVIIINIDLLCWLHFGTHKGYTYVLNFIIDYTGIS